MSVRASVIPAGTSLTGSIEGSGDLVVAGVVEGPVQITGELVVEDGASLRGDVRAQSVIVRGQLIGEVSAKAFVRADPTATVVGDVTAARVNIVEGARVRGRVTMTGEVPERPAPRTPRAHARGARADDTEGPRRAPVAVEKNATDEMPRPARGRPSKRARTVRRGRSEPREPAPAESPGAESRATPERSPATPTRAIRRPEPPSRGQGEPSSLGKRRRTGRKPPPPTIPAVQRQKARRKDRSTEPSP